LVPYRANPNLKKLVFPIRKFHQGFTFVGYIERYEQVLQFSQNTCMKKLSWLIAAGLSLGWLLAETKPAQAGSDAGTNIHIEQSRQFPETRWANVDHFIRVHVPSHSNALTELWLEVSENLKFEDNQVEVFDLQGKNIPVLITEGSTTQTLGSERMIQLIFPTPIASGTQFEIRIKNVKKNLISRPATYIVLAKIIGGDRSVLVGSAYFRSY
jgi:Protein of unknown function (DUF2808)